MNWNWK